MITLHCELQMSGVARGVRENADQKQEAISQKEIVFRFRKDVQSEKGWG